MKELDIWYETVQTPATFLHVRSADGVLGHAKEIRERVPIGTWLNVHPEYQPALTAYLVKKCGFAFVGCLLVEGELNDLLQKIA